MENLNEGSENQRKRKPIKYTLITLIIVVLISSYVGVFYLGNYAATNGVIIGDSTNKAISDLEQVGDIDKYSKLFGLRSLLYAKYDGEINDEYLLEGAMKGMASSLEDPYTVYMTKDEYNEFIEYSQGSFYGIGAQLGVRDDNITIIAQLEGTPAEKAGLRAGDKILQVDDYVVTDLNTDEVVSRVRGEKGDPVKLVIQRGDGDPFEVEIIREEIMNESVTGEMLDDSIGYIKISTFSDEEVSTKFTNEMNELKKQGMKKLILDLRGNPGGYLNECIDIASHFIKEGEIVTYTVDKYNKKVVSESAGGDSVGMPLVVLVDGGSASASEVVTGALRDHNAATIIGTNTFGKGIVQQLIPLSDDMGALKVTTSKYYTPNGENIHKTGIAPDIEVTIPIEFFESEYDRNNDPQFLKAVEVIKEKNN